MATTHTVLPLLPLALYLLAALTLERCVRSGGRPDRRIATLLGAVGLVLHAAILFRSLSTGQGLSLAITDSASLVGWVIAATTVVAMALQDLAALPSAMLALAGLLAVGTGVATGFSEIAAPQWEITAHIALAALASGWLSIAVLVVILLAVQQRRLRARAPLGLLMLMPPVETMETTLFRAIGGGFVVLTFALVTGFFFVYDLVSQHLVHKMALALLAWVVFGVLLWGRYRFGWRGRKALQFTIVGFVSLTLAYFGSKFVLETLLGRHWG